MGGEFLSPPVCCKDVVFPCDGRLPLRNAGYGSRRRFFLFSTGRGFCFRGCAEVKIQHRALRKAYTAPISSSRTLR